MKWNHPQHRHVKKEALLGQPCGESSRALLGDHHGASLKRLDANVCNVGNNQEEQGIGVTTTSLESWR